MITPIKWDSGGEPALIDEIGNFLRRLPGLPLCGLPAIQGMEEGIKSKDIMFCQVEELAELKGKWSRESESTVGSTRAS